MTVVSGRRACRDPRGDFAHERVEVRQADRRSLVQELHVDAGVSVRDDVAQAGCLAERIGGGLQEDAVPRATDPKTRARRPCSPTSRC